MIIYKSYFNTTNIRRNMFFLIFFIILIGVIAILIFILIANIFQEGIVATFSRKESWLIVLISIACILASIVCFDQYKIKIQSDAIDHYIVGDYELIEKRVDGEVVDWTYKVIPADYE